MRYRISSFTDTVSAAKFITNLANDRLLANSNVSLSHSSMGGYLVGYWEVTDEE